MHYTVKNRGVSVRNLGQVFILIVLITAIEFILFSYRQNKTPQQVIPVAFSCSLLSSAGQDG